MPTVLGSITGGVSFNYKDALRNIKLMHEHGAKIIDIGAESTKPGSEPISYIDETGRPKIVANDRDEFITPSCVSIIKNEIVVSPSPNATISQPDFFKKYSGSGVGPYPPIM